MRLQEITTIYDYNYWANGRILTAGSGLTKDQFASSAAFPHGGLRATLLHILSAEFGWRMQIQNKPKIWSIEDLDERDFPTLVSMRQRWDEEEAAMRAYLAGLTDGDLTGIIRYDTEEGNHRERPLWHCLYHVVNHGTQHRSEAAAILTGFGQSPGDVDFTLFMNERK